MALFQMKKNKMQGMIIKPFSGIVEAESYEEAESIFYDNEKLVHFIHTGNLSVKGQIVTEKLLKRVSDNTVINYY